MSVLRLNFGLNGLRHKDVDVVVIGRSLSGMEGSLVNSSRGQLSKPERNGVTATRNKQLNSIQYNQNIYMV